jgi:hypothetical protein
MVTRLANKSFGAVPSTKILAPENERKFKGAGNNS